MKIGNTTVNLEALITVTKAEFIETHKKNMYNVEAEANKLNKYFKQEVKLERVPSDDTQSKKKKRNRK